ncbi:MAG TPA: hypothetical protein VMS77_05280 [Conexivisphaerales archaeon]|nr:hypothetical protein [Conexivisphaerales archaeon]
MDDFLREAREAYEHGLYASAVVMSYAALLHLLSKRFRRDDISLKELAELAYRDGSNVDPKSLGKLSWVRNRVIHEGYLPRRDEARWAVRTAERNLEGLEAKGLLGRILAWLRG